MAEWNIHPVHLTFVLEGSSSTHTSLSSPYQSSNKAYQTLTLEGSGSSHSSGLRTSGFQYLLTSGPVSKTFQEVINVSDPIPVRTESINILDQLSKTEIKLFQEVINITDLEIQSGVQFNTIDSMLIQVQGTFGDIDTTNVEVIFNFSEIDSTRIAVTPYTLIPTVNASSASNVFLPTIILGGTVYTSSITTTIPASSINQYTNYVQVADVQIGDPINTCSIIDGSLTLDYGGGHFDIQATTTMAGTNPFANLGLNFNLAGFTATVVDFGQEINSSRNIYKTSGIFGNPLLNKQLDLLAGSSYLLQLLSNPQLSVSNSMNWFPYSEVAHLITSLIGNISLVWAANDYYLTEAFSLQGITVKDALQRLASLAGAQLRWDGNNNYIVAYPYQSYGSFDLPDSRLVQSVSTDYIADLEYGVYGTGLFVFPEYVIAPTNQSTTNNGPQIRQVRSFTNLSFDSTSANVTIDLPNNVFEAYIQILPTNNSQDNAGFVNSSVAPIASKYVQADDTTWFDLGGPSITSSFVGSKTVGGSYVPQVTLGFGNLPDLSLINGGNHVLNIGCTLQSLGPAFSLAQNEKRAIVRNVLGRSVDQFTFVPYYKANINIYFHGSIPLPGMYLNDFTLCGNTIEGGIIESVSYNFRSKILSLNVTKYVEIGFVYRYVDLNSSNATGANSRLGNQSPYIK